ncbi:MAG: CopD family protein [Flammeovirgaceae bacterium]
MTILYIKSLHIIFVVSWFAALFYMPRLFVYFAEAKEKPENERLILQKQLLLMQRRLWKIIMQPAMVITIITGFYLTYLYGFFTQSWLHLKLFLVFLLLTYHIVCGRIIAYNEKGIHSNSIPYTAFKMRIWNEVATLLLFGIVFLVVFKDGMSILWGMGGILALGVVLMILIKLYKKLREKNPDA